MSEQSPGKGKNGRPSVEFVNLRTNAAARFNAAWADRLRTVWERAYDELRERKQEADQLQCATGESLMDHLDETLEELRERKICQARKFEIRGPTGGA